MKNKIIIKLGDIAYPKAKAMIIPGNTVGLMTRGIARRILVDSLGSVRKEAKKIVKETIPIINECFVTGPGRLNRRGLVNIYHAVIRRFPSDFTTLMIVSKTLDFTLRQVIKDGHESVSICGLGIDVGGIDKQSAAMIFLSICEKYIHRIQIKIIDGDKEFIDELEKLNKE